jgi:K+-sensing histidine kinase KdpD
MAGETLFAFIESKSEGRASTMRLYFWKSNGHRPGRKPTAAAASTPLRVQQEQKSRYGFAIFSVLMACGCVLVTRSLFSFPLLLFFVLALILTATYSGLRPALLALVLAILLSDFFFVHPAYELSLNGIVFRISLYYSAGVLLGYYLVKRSGARLRSYLLFPF